MFQKADELTCQTVTSAGTFSSNYTELVPNIITTIDLLEAMARGAACGRVVAVKFYSKVGASNRGMT